MAHEPAHAAEARGDTLDAHLLALLSMDGRMSLRDLSAATRASLTTVRRRPQSMLGSRLVLRCDLARPLSGRPLSAVYFASVPGQYVEETSRALSGVREVRSCAITAGPHNLVIDVWLRDLRDGHAFEAHERSGAQSSPSSSRWMCVISSAADALMVSSPARPQRRGSVSTTQTVPRASPVRSMSGAPR